jgi:hypothetical protein
LNDHDKAGTDRISEFAVPVSDEQVEFLKVEVEHFYKAETQSEQRASWLLTVAFGGLALVLNSFPASPGRQINPRAIPILIASASFLFCAVASALFAVWPLQGRRGRLQRPYTRSSIQVGSLLPAAAPIDFWSQQYAAHRLRAEKKAARVVVTLLLLELGVAIAGLAALINAGFI